MDHVVLLYRLNVNCLGRHEANTHRAGIQREVHAAGHEKPHVSKRLRRGAHAGSPDGGPGC